MEASLADLAYTYFPHRFCLSYNPWLVLSAALNSAMIAACYLSIFAIFLMPPMRRWPLRWLFMAFIGCCGAGHAMDFLTLTTPDYYQIEALIDTLTTLFSIPAAISFALVARRWAKRDREVLARKQRAASIAPHQ